MEDFLTLRVTEREAEMIMDALHIVAEAGGDRRGHAIMELTELHDDLFEQVARRDDDWLSTEPTEIAENTFIQAGIDGREQAKAGSRAADRRNERMMKGTARPIANDPVDW